ncbi:transcriptional activator TtdR [compost metagenome]
MREHGTPLSVPDLTAHRLISNAATPSHNQWSFRVNGEHTTLSVKGQVQVNSSASVISLALCGAGIARMNDVVGQALVDAGKLLPVLPQAVERGSHSIFAVILSTRHRAPKVRATMDYLQTCFASFATPTDNGAELLRPGGA